MFMRPFVPAMMLSGKFTSSGRSEAYLTLRLDFFVAVQDTREAVAALDQLGQGLNDDELAESVHGILVCGDNRVGPRCKHLGLDGGFGLCTGAGQDLFLLVNVATATHDSLALLVAASTFTAGVRERAGCRRDATCLQGCWGWD